MSEETLLCTTRKHWIENGARRCDCGKLMIAQTVAKNARVVTILDPVQADALSLIAKETS